MWNRERGRERATRADCRDLRRSIVKGTELAKDLVPLFPLLFRGVKTIPHVAQELNLHDVDLLHRYARHLRPCLIGVRVVVQKLVAEHQSNGQKSIFATRLALDTGIGLLQLPHKQESQKDNVLSDLRRGQNRCYPFAKSGRGCRVWYERLDLVCGRIGICDLAQDLGAFEPE